MSHDLSEFVDLESGWSEAADERSATCSRDVFVFQYGSQTYAVSAFRVAGVIPWREPVPLPRSDPRVSGVIQDRGRIVVMMVHPSGEGVADPEADIRRIIICESERGFVGLPATSTVTVGPVEFAREPNALGTVDTSAGVLTYLDPSSYVQR
ncbi:MAG: chemotaxis protein CheW [Polyangiaceae bacterium]|nr:chemotaxis protein CheW [Polyangiaceae bacterium]